MSIDHAQQRVDVDQQRRDEAPHSSHRPEYSQGRVGKTIQQITRVRCAAIAVPDEGTEQLVAIIELKKRGESDEEVMHKFGVIKSEVTSAISNSHGLAVADLVLVPPGSIPITTNR